MRSERSSSVVRAVLGAAVACAACAPSAALALPTIANPGFDSGTLSGWTTFTTANGDNPSPTVSSFDTDNDGSASNAARFNVGLATSGGFDPNVRGGGGIFQSVFVDVGGDYQFGLDVASNNAAPPSPWSTPTADVTNSSGTVTSSAVGLPAASSSRTGPLPAARSPAR